MRQKLGHTKNRVRVRYIEVLLEDIFVDYSKVRKTGKTHSSVDPILSLDPRYFLFDWPALTRTPVTSQPRQSPQRYTDYKLRLFLSNGGYI